jgi:hypothetical protein
MAQQHYKTLFKKALLQFITEPDPFLAMLKWVMTELGGRRLPLGRELLPADDLLPHLIRRGLSE